MFVSVNKKVYICHMTLKEKIQEKGITQAFIARKLRMTRQQLNLWLGTNNIPEDKKRQIESIIY